jgi:hypothetical protein
VSSCVRRWLAERAFEVAYWLGAPWWRRYAAADRVFYEREPKR